MQDLNPPGFNLQSAMSDADVLTTQPPERLLHVSQINRRGYDQRKKIVIFDDNVNVEQIGEFHE